MNDTPAHDHITFGVVGLDNLPHQRLTLIQKEHPAENITTNTPTNFSRSLSLGCSRTSQSYIHRLRLQCSGSNVRCDFRKHRVQRREVFGVIEF